MRRTIVTSIINDDHTGFVQNFGLDELSLFKKLSDNGIELKNEENISNNELLMILRHCCVDGFIEGVFSIENHFNRDQKEINIIKDNIEKKLKQRGIQIITHCDWQPSFDYEEAKTTINKRNYLTILTENINNKKDELERIYNELDEKNEEIKELSKKIKNQNWYLEQSQNYETLYNQWKLKFDNIVERYNKGKEVCEQQEKNAKDNWPNELKELERNIQEKKDEIESLSRNEKELKSNINESQKQLEYIENRIKYYESELDSILDKYNTVQ